MKQALVIHPRFTLYGGGELLCLNVIQALQEKGYKVTLASDNYDPRRAWQIYGPIGNTLRAAKHLEIPSFKRVFPRFLAYQHIRYAGQVNPLFEKVQPDVVFSTQSSLYYVKGVDTFHFIYDMIDLSVVKFAKHVMSSWWKWPYYQALKKYRSMLEKPEPNRHFLALGKNISRDLDDLGYQNKFIIPPCPIDYGPLPKKKEVVMVTRIVPQKRLEEFGEIASKFSYPFHILGLTNKPFRSYKENLLRKMPENVRYHETPLRDAPEILQESKVYLYTSHEPGLPIALIQGMGAGCLPIVPDVGGGREAVEIAEDGSCYTSVEDAVRLIRIAMDTDLLTENLVKASRRFSPELFRERVGDLVP